MSLWSLSCAVFPYTIKHDNFVVHRVADQRKQSGDDRQVDLSIREREQAQRDDNVVNGRNDRCGACNPLEPESNVDQHTAQSIKSRHQGLLPQSLAGAGAYDLHRTEVESAQPTFLLDGG